MWIKRDTFQEIISHGSKIQARLELREEQIERLQKEVDYWREKFEEAQNRADRISDSALKTSGIGPVSDLGIREVTEQSKIYEKMMKDAEKQATEMFAEEIPSQVREEGIVLDENLAEALVSGFRSE